MPIGLSRALSLALRPGLLVLLGLLVLPLCASAHPPSDMQLAFDPGNRTLSVTITHVVVDPSTHYVRRVLVTEGGTVISNATYGSQPSPTTFTYSYPIPEGVSGEIQVQADCSVFGSTIRTIQVRGAPAAGMTPVPARPPVPPVAPGRNQPVSTTAPATGTVPTKADPGLLPVASALALASAWRFRR